jgi:hypothetical protein
VEASLLDIFDYMPDQRRPVDGVEVAFDLIRCEHLRIPSYMEYQGGSIVGAGLESILFINLDAIRESVYAVERLYRRFAGREGVLLEDPAPDKASGMDALDTSESLGLSARLYYRSFRTSGDRPGIAAYMGARFDTVLVHELRHLADARLFLPVTRNLAWKIYQFSLRGFSSFNIEAWLEERAQLNALLHAKDVYIALAEIVDHLGTKSRVSPHGKGYTNLMIRMVRYIHDHPDLFPAIDREAHLLHQLHKLTRDEIRFIARTLAEEEGFFPKEASS